MCRRIVRAGDRERSVRFAERLAESRDSFDRHTGARARRGRIEIFDRLAQRREVEARVGRDHSLLDQNVEHAPRHIRLRARRRRYPVVALRRRHAEPRTDVSRASYRQCAASLLRRAEQRVLAREFHRRLPGLEKVRAEGYQNFSLIDSIGRQIAPSEQRLRCDARRLLIDCLVKYRTRRIVGADKRQRDFPEGGALRRAQERNAILARL